ncbi:diguanylate cyclase [bacterium]|nr:diguanylate cyclase [bacterium]MBT3853769.1 diguanylate cyclase [bacterium]MBT4633207.1 diguanylate cyclase [bacterium]MBT5492188.1 diguanylate cyclase [bacterium]MBT6779240.1 diguanylate cyclase [bacterium]
MENTLNSKIADYKRNLDNTAILLVDIDYFKSINDHY